MDYSLAVKLGIAIFILIAGIGLAPAQTNEMDVGELLDAAQQFAQDNLDPDVLQALQSVDRSKVEDFLNHFQDYLKGDQVLDVAQLKDAANIALPLLDAHEETQPYAAWLRSRLDYFDATDELKLLVLPTPQLKTNQAPSSLNPSFTTEREVWIKKVLPRPLPKGSEKFVPKLKSIFATERVPSALVWLAEVESGFDASARSPEGAVGMFQLMPETAKDLGLSLLPFDQRKQFEPAGRASAKYLRQLHDQFGDWRLAVAAYNSGPGMVSRLLKRYQTTRYERIAPYLPAETQMYVPKVEATILHREGLELEKLKVTPSTKDAT
jgi:membrane-bound lytic murein transglycosylase D